MDSASRLPVGYVTIGLKPHHSVAIKSIVTKEDGSFVLENIKPGNYLLDIIAVGYRLRSVPVILGENSIN